MNFIESFQELYEQVKTQINSICIVNGACMFLEDIEGLGWKEFAIRSKLNMPLKLYKYYPNTIKCEDGKLKNYSQMALKNNTVYLASPIDFDDVYDSDINVEYADYERLRLEEYCKRCGISTEKTDKVQDIVNRLAKKLFSVSQETGDFSKAIVLKPDTELKSKSNESFILKVKLEICKGNDLIKALSNVILSDYSEYIKSIKETFRVSSFTTSPYSQLMWGGLYSDCHRGFCVEYTILSDEEKYKEQYCNLFPVVYCKKGSEKSDILVKMQDEEPTDEYVWDLYFHGALRKSIDWAFQNEWRLLLPKGMEKKNGYNMPFFPITKVYLGNRMCAEKRHEIIELCHENGIPYVGVIKNPKAFEMVECEMKCENCVRCMVGTEEMGYKTLSERWAPAKQHKLDQ